MPLLPQPKIQGPNINTSHSMKCGRKDIGLVGKRSVLELNYISIIWLQGSVIWLKLNLYLYSYPYLYLY